MAFAPAFQRLPPHRTEAIPTATPLRGRCALQPHNRQQQHGHRFQALFSNTTGSDNTATGSNALYSKTHTGLPVPTRPTVIKRSIATQPAATTRPTVSHALFSNTTGDDNTATGSQALFNNTTGSDNTANGAQALFIATQPAVGNNTANGYWCAL